MPCSYRAAASPCRLSPFIWNTNASTPSASTAPFGGSGYDWSKVSRFTRRTKWPAWSQRPLTNAPRSEARSYSSWKMTHAVPAATVSGTASSVHVSAAAVCAVTRASQLSPEGRIFRPAIEVDGADESVHVTDVPVDAIVMVVDVTSSVVTKAPGGDAWRSIHGWRVMRSRWTSATVSSMRP